MKRVIVLATLLVLAAACARSDGGDLGPVGPGNPEPSPAQTTPPPEPSPSPTSGPAGGDTMTFEVWFAAGQGFLFVTRRTEPASPRIGTVAVEALLEGPTAPERDAGVASAVPQGSELLGLTIEDGLATVDLSRGFESGGGSLSVMLRLAQLTYTLTQFPTVDGVVLELEGEPVETFSGEGLIVDHPMTRETWSDLLPAILVEGPGIGERVSSPFTVTGTADLFEATVSISLLDASGRELVRTFTTATCGTGCRGMFSKTIRYEVASSQTGTLRVYEASAENGEPINVVEIPVVLST
jgi:hypothetical protein